MCSASASSVLKHFSVCSTKHSRFSPKAYASIFVTCMSPLGHMPFHLGEPHHQKLAAWIVKLRKEEISSLSLPCSFFFQSVHHHWALIISINRLPIWPPSTSACCPHLIQHFGCLVIQKAFRKKRQRLKWKQ